MADLTYHIKGAGGEDYTTIGACNTAVAKDISAGTGSSQTVEIVVHDNLTETTTDIDTGWTTDSTYFVTIRAANGTGDEPDVRIEGGFNKTGKGALAKDTAYGNAMTVITDYTHIKDLYIHNSSGLGRVSLTIATGAASAKLENCVVDLDTSQDLQGLYNYSSTGKFWKCLFRCVGGKAAENAYLKAAEFKNCGAVESNIGFHGGSSAKLENCFTMDCTTEYNDSYGTSSYNAGETATAGDIPGTNSVTSIGSSDFEDAANDDYTAAASGALDGAGTSQSSHFTIDALGNTISSWPIGINEPQGGATALVIADSTHTHNADNVALTQDHLLAIADAAHSHSAENVTLSVIYALSVQDALHSHSADSAALTQTHNLSVADSSHAHTADNATLAQVHILSVNESTHGHSADNLSLTQDHVLTIQESSHGHTADNLTLTIQGALNIASAVHGHTSDNLDLTQAHNLTVADAVHAHTADNVSLSFGVALDIADATHSHSADNLDLTTNYALQIQDAVHALQSANVDLTQQHTLIISDALHAQLADQCNVYDPSTISSTEKRVMVINSEGRTLVVMPSNRNLTIN